MSSEARFAAPDATGRARWLMYELGGYLAGTDAPPDARDAAARTALRNGHHAFGAFVRSRCAPTDVVCTELVIERANGHICRIAYRDTPNPLTLLVLCATTCFDSDRVTVRQITAQSGTVTTTERWPFGLACAEQMTIPAVDRMAPLLTDASKVRRRETAIGNVGLIVECRRQSAPTRWPRVRITRQHDGDGVQLEVRWRQRGISIAVRTRVFR